MYHVRALPRLFCEQTFDKVGYEVAACVEPTHTHKFIYSKDNTYNPEERSPVAVQRGTHDSVKETGSDSGMPAGAGRRRARRDSRTSFHSTWLGPE